MNIAPYLSFDGQCDAAFELYARVLGGEITMKMHYAEAPMPSDPADAGRVMHVCLQAGGHEIMGSDRPQHHPGAAKSGMSVAVALPTAEKAHEVFTALAEGGTVGMPMAATFWTPAFGMLTDRFGTPWLVSAEGPAPG